MKIKRLIMAMLLVFSLVPLYIFGSVMIASTQRNFEKMESDNLEALSNTIIMNIESYTENQRLSMLQVAQTKSVQQAVKASIDGTLDPESTYYDYMEDVLQESREYAEYVVSVSIVDVNYKVVGSTENFMLQESSTLRNVSADILNQDFYKNDPDWLQVRDEVIIRDDGCDLGIKGRTITGCIFVHHINPITKEQIITKDRSLYDPNNLICCSKRTHDAIHYSSSS